MGISKTVRSIAVGGAFLIGAPSASAVCVITEPQPTAVLPTGTGGQTFSFVATDDCATLRFAVLGSALTEIPDRHEAVGPNRHRYGVSLSAMQWQSVTGPSVTTFRWRITGRTTGGGVTQVTTTNQLDIDGDGWTRSEGDEGTCDRRDAINPGVNEDCGNDLDDDCNGQVDDCSFPLIDADLTIHGGDPDITFGGIGGNIAIGDFDADGDADLLFGNGEANGNRGEAYIVEGPASGVRSTGAATLLSSALAHGFFGDGVGAGDADGDGIDDVLVGAPQVPIDTAYLFLGPVTSDRVASSADARLVGPDNGLTGFTLRVVPDTDGSGDADLVVGAIDGGDRPRGMVYVAPGTSLGAVDLASDATYAFEGVDVGDQLGRGMASMGDTNGDGIAELALSSLAGAYIIEGGIAAGTYAVDDAASAYIGGASAHGNLLGWSLAVADYDDDGATDLFLGAPFSSGPGGSDGGTVTAFLGPITHDVGFPQADTTWVGTNSGDDMGSSIAIGDVDGDGDLDVLMGAQDAGPTQGGNAYLQLGFASGAVDVGDLMSFPSAPVSSLGTAVAIIPDWTGDGGDEVLLGAPGQSGPAGDGVGAVFVFYSDSLFE